MYEGIIFDLNGTLADTSYGTIESVNLSLQEEGLPKLPPERIMPYIGGGAQKLIYSIFKSINVTNEQLAQNVCKNFSEYYLTYCDKNLINLVDFNLVKQFCKENNIVIAIYTNKDKSYTNKILETLHIDCKEIICPPDFPLKPDSTGIDYLVTKYNFPRKNTVIVGDSIVDYQTAMNSKIKCVLVSWGFSSVRELKTCFNFTLINNSIAEITTFAIIANPKGVAISFSVSSSSIHNLVFIIHNSLLAT